MPEGLALSRSRLQALIAAGAVTGPAGPLTDPAGRVEGCERLTLVLPEAAPTADAPEAIPLVILYEDDALLVIDKPAGLVVHPAPGAPSGTLVNALLHHVGDRLDGIGGVRRPGIVHRLDKDTSGVLVVAKTDEAHGALSEAFRAHAIEREYLALTWGVPDAAEPRLANLPGVGFEPGGTIRIDAPIGRHPSDRKRMAVVPRGRRAVTRAALRACFGSLAALVACRLETGRTHQIRVHLAHLGHPLIGDPVYGRRRSLPKAVEPSLAAALAGFRRQALHAARLGFVHPVTGATLVFETPPPADFTTLCEALRNHSGDASLDLF